ncbi:MAG: hypothetical protein CL402_11470 [Acidiferrobacteraceae bacterium]|nr:hypothetical protein [Acidiferrobacteraceae bacterium]|tara:strand:+ start:9645 stop:10457 length:813 start_codon:yes stop_codon:yes gene_type:complete
MFIGKLSQYEKCLSYYETDYSMNEKMHIKTKIIIVISLISLLVSFSSVKAEELLNGYEVKPGDTVCNIAEQYKVPCAQLMKRNNLAGDGLIYPGQILHLPDSAEWNYSLPCQIRIISWVNVDVKGSYTAASKASFEKNIRRLLRSQIPSLSHEAQEYGALWSKVTYDESNEAFLDIDVGNDKRFIKRGEVNCRIWSSVDEDPVAIHLQCTLSGWGNYKPTIYDDYEVEALKTASLDKLVIESESLLQGLISQMSKQLTDDRKKECPSTLK